MKINQSICQAELTEHNLIPRKYYGQVFTTDETIIQKLVDTIKTIYKPDMKIVEVGGGLGYITERLIRHFEDVECVEFDNDLYKILVTKFTDFCHSERADASRRMNKKFVLNKNMAYLKEKSDKSNKFFEHNFISESKKSKNQKKPLSTKINNKGNLRLIHGDILEYQPSESEDRHPHRDYLLVGNIPFHISGKLYRKFMSDLKHKPAGMVFITDKQYAKTLMGQPPRCYRVSLQAQSYGDIEIVTDVPPTSVYPEPKVMSCIVKIVQNGIKLPKNFWNVVNHHWENFPTKEVESPKTVGLEGWIKLCKKSPPLSS